jgi:hypothetical protein
VHLVLPRRRVAGSITRGRRQRARKRSHRIPGREGVHGTGAAGAWMPACLWCALSCSAGPVSAARGGRERPTPVLGQSCLEPTFDHEIQRASGRRQFHRGRPRCIAATQVAIAICEAQPSIVAEVIGRSRSTQWSLRWISGRARDARKRPAPPPSGPANRLRGSRLGARSVCRSSRRDDLFDRRPGDRDLKGLASELGQHFAPRTCLLATIWI